MDFRIFKYIMPILRENAIPAVKTVGKELLKSAANLVNDSLSGEDLKSSAKKRLQTSESIKKISDRFIPHEGEGLALRPDMTINSRKRKFKERKKIKKEFYTFLIRENETFYRSNECAKSELDLFMTPSTNTSLVSGGWFEINPTSSLSICTPIEFRYEGSTNHYLQLSRTSLYLQVSIYKDKVLVTGDDATAPINNFLHSLFSQVELSFNGQSFENSNNVYPYKAYITDLLKFGQDSKNSYLQSNLFYKDDAGRFDTISSQGDANFVAN
ncbi:unnamed protein product [Brachionus calyciflorus]|uniref:Uncharacterized protein n=1 Tax=Brachionus calyciflorus TaxID=104777 RepID=A0A814N5K2_9BILA|nr:unnamed protein product [Brachionus calyciflorus]